MKNKVVSTDIPGDSGDFGQGETDALPNGVPSWARYMPGPSPTYRFGGLPPKVSRIGVVACGCCIMSLSGYNLALMGSISGLDSYLQVVGLTDGSNHTQLLIGLINCVYWIGVILGALLVGSFSDHVGRRRAIVFTGIFALAIIPTFASLQSFPWALALRFLNGCATGSFDSVGLNWSAESADHRHRGRTMGILMCCAATGAAIAYFIPYGLAKQATGEIVWRLPMTFQLIYVITVLSMVCFLPESPRWLVKVGLTHAARDGLRSVKSIEDSIELEETVESELLSIAQAIETERIHNSSASYWAMLTSPDDLKTTWSAIFIQFATQAMVGSGFVSGYGIQIFETGGWSSELAALLAGLGIITQAVFGLPGALLSDTIGRRKAMIGGSAIGAIVLALIGMCGYFVNKYTHTNPVLAKSYGSATVALVFLWDAIFGATWQWLPTELEYLESYWDHVHSHFPLFSSAVELQQTAATNLLLKASVLGVGAFFYLSGSDSERQHQVTLAFLSRFTELSGGEIEHVCIPNIKSFLLRSYLAVLQGKLESATVFLGIACNAAKLMGLHVDPASLHNEPYMQQSSDNIDRRITFWACFFLDRRLAILQGRAVLMAACDVSIQSPLHIVERTLKERNDGDVTAHDIYAYHLSLADMQDGTQIDNDLARLDDTKIRKSKRPDAGDVVKFGFMEGAIKLAFDLVLLYHISPPVAEVRRLNSSGIGLSGTFRVLHPDLPSLTRQPRR
ncbi:low-affinity glucose transporter hxt3 [Colletotrichum camelliae]|nr:low-affinity glucose transporter hxt3 [Colletotrichum camelliae]